MKVLHTAALLRPPAGIINQMRWEQEAAQELELDWHVRLFCPQGWTDEDQLIQPANRVRAASTTTSLKNLRNWLSLRYEYYKWLRRQEESTDIFLIRYYVHDPFQLWFVRTCSKPVYLVHHSLEEPELALPNTTSARIRSKLDALIGRPTIRLASGIIGVTQEIIDHEKKRGNVPNKKAHLYPNGIHYSAPPVADRRGTTPELLFVAGTFAPWHGLDLLVDSITQNRDTEFVLHLVGNVPDAEQKRIAGDPRIVLHGTKQHHQIREIAESCWAGLSSFALHRNQMHEACTLKVREYLMMGLPVCAAYQEVLGDDFPYYFTTTADINNIIKNLAQGPLPDRETVAQTAKPKIQKTQLLKNLIPNLFPDKDQ